MSFEGIIGNDDVKKYLSDVVRNQNSSQSYLFVGNDGIGKCLIAKEFAKQMLCLEQGKKENCDCKSCGCFQTSNHPDYFILNEEGETIKIEEIRKMITNMIEQPILSEKKVYIINDCHKMTTEAQNCLLKTLEEPPQFAIIILITSNEYAILNTIKSRCIKVQFNPISEEELKKYAVDKLGYTQMTENLLKSFNGSIGKAILQKENQEKFLQVENIIENLSSQNIIDIMNSSKVIYDKENIETILDYMMICVYNKAKENKAYIGCIEIIDHCMQALKRNCNFDMTVDTMLFEMCECFGKGT